MKEWKTVTFDGQQEVIQCIVILIVRLLILLGLIELDCFFDYRNSIPIPPKENLASVERFRVILATAYKQAERERERVKPKEVGLGHLGRRTKTME